MADITAKKEILRRATAEGRLKLRRGTVRLMKSGRVAKGDPLAAAQLAAVMAAKNTHQMIPLCHPLPITNVTTKYKLYEDALSVEASVKTTAKTGVEMEALVAASVFLLTVWDMVKQYEKDRAGQYPETAITMLRVKRKIKGQR
jgi:cyclic pyranopterin phosphate synthase